MLNHTPVEGQATPVSSVRSLLRLGNLGRPLDLPADLAAAFRRALGALIDAHIPCAIGGGIATYAYTGEHRDVHDLDIHLLPEDVEPAMEALRRAGFSTWVRLQPWLAQAQLGETQVDLIYGQGSWHCSTDRDWITRGRLAGLLGHDVRIVPVEEILWSKCLRMARVRTDQSDVHHLLLAVAPDLDWDHLLALFGEDWEVLLTHLILFRYVFPSHANLIPDTVLDDLLARLAESRAHPYAGPPLCRGALLDTSGPYEHYRERGFIDEQQRRWEQRLEREPVLQRLTRTYPEPAGDGDDR